MSREGREGRGSSGGGSSSSVSLWCCRLGWGGGGVPIPILNAVSCRAGAAQWWRRQHVQEFFPTVSLGDPTLDGLLAQHGLKVGSTPHTSPSPVGHSLKLTPPHNPLFSPLPQDKLPLKRPVDAFLPWLLSSVRQLSRPFSPHVVLWSLYLVAATTCLLRAMARRPRGGAPPTCHKAPKQPRGDQGEKNGQLRRKEGREAEERGEGRSRGAADGEGPRGTKRRK